MTESLMNEWQSWNDQNPLRLHRRKHRLSIVTSASMLGVSVNTLAKWEAGISEPNESNLDRLSSFIGRPMKQPWLNWRARKPKPAAAAAQ